MQFSSLVSIRILKGMDTCFEQGICELLKSIKRTGSVKATATEMKISNARVLKRIKNSELILGYPLLIRQIGGAGGGYSHLTERACRLIDQYMKLESETNSFVESYLNEYFAEFLDEKDY